MIVVVDASVVIKWYVSEIHTAEAEQLLDGRFELHAPELLLPEFGNILWKKCRQNDLDEKEAALALKLYLEQNVVLHPQNNLLKTALLGAFETGQAVYDWTYLSLALSLRCPLVTADRRFYIGLRNMRFSQHLVWVENIPTLA